MWITKFTLFSILLLFYRVSWSVFNFRTVPKNVRFTSDFMFTAFLLCVESQNRIAHFFLRMRENWEKGWCLWLWMTRETWLGKYSYWNCFSFNYFNFYFILLNFSKFKFLNFLKNSLKFPINFFTIPNPSKSAFDSHLLSNSIKYLLYIHKMLSLYWWSRELRECKQLI